MRYDGTERQAGGPSMSMRVSQTNEHHNNKTTLSHQHPDNNRQAARLPAPGLPHAPRVRPLHAGPRGGAPATSAAARSTSLGATAGGTGCSSSGSGSGSGGTAGCGICAAGAAGAGGG